MINAALIPLRVDEAIGKSQHQEVLDRFLTKVVINTIDVALVKVLRQRVVDVSRSLKALANGFLQNDTTRPGEAAVLAKLLANGGE